MFPLKMGLKFVPLLYILGISLDTVHSIWVFSNPLLYVPNVTLETDGFISINVNVGHL